MVSRQTVRRLPARFGKPRSQAAKLWTGDIPLPPAVEKFYAEIGPAGVEIESHGNPFYLPRLSELWALQAGYRWNGQTGEPIESWNPNWLVVAREGANPFLFDRRTAAVSFALCGAGAWKPRRLFPDLNAMAASLAVIGGMLKDAGDSAEDDDCNLRPAFVGRVTKRLQKLLASESQAKAVVRTLL